MNTGPEPVAVLGIGCRLPGGADSPDRFWDLLIRGEEAISELPPDRWQAYSAVGPDFAAVVRRTPKRGGFLADVESFDADFFGISPREAELMDPQQRLLLELAWEALEHAGIPPHRLAGGDAGVFVGIGSDDYGRRLLEDLPRIEAWTGIGAAMCGVANRISHALDLRGPSLAVDTACSSSLVALHLACQSLRSRECGVALTAGVNLIVAPGLSVTLDQAGAISPDGRCKSFDSCANGYGRGEGGAVLVLKRLADAVADGDRVLALVRGSAVGQDGRTNGIMAPSGPAQEELLRRAYRQAGVEPSTVDYVEAHGTGTVAGDPVEAGALGAVFGPGRPAGEACLIGSVKSNIGHLEAGSGVAGVVKAVLALAYGEIPPNLSMSEPNPDIPWAEARLRVVGARVPWPRRDRPRRAGVSGFGYGGTLAHVVLEEAPSPESRPAEPDPGTPSLFVLSGRSAEALRGNASRLAGWLAGLGTGAPLGAVAHTLGARHTHLDRRAAIVATDRSELVERLGGLAAGEPVSGVTEGTVLTACGPGPVWVFSGHGSQWSGMGRELRSTHPGFAAVIDELDSVFAEEVGWRPGEVMLGGDLGGVDRIQAMLFAVQVGLAEVWRGYGVVPAAIIGHSVGEIAAAVAAGVLDLRDGARLACRRGRLLRRAAGAGRMAMVNLPFAETAERLGDGRGVVAAVAASPSSTVVAGDAAAVEALIQEWTAADLLVRPVASDVAFHSPHMDPLIDELAASAGALEYRPPRVPLYSTALADPRTTVPRNGAYWAANLRNPVRFAGAVAAAIDDGHRAFLEISAHPVVTHSILETLAAVGVQDQCVVGTLRREAPEMATLLANAGTLYCHGVPVDWAALCPGELVTLPTTAWQRKRFWRDSVGTGSGSGQHDPGSHTLLGTGETVAGSVPTRLWRTRVELDTRPYPGNHTLHGTEIVPAAVLLQTFLSAGGDTVQDVSLELALPLDEPREVQVVAQDGALRLSSRPAGGGEWLTHATAMVAGSATEQRESDGFGAPAMETLPDGYVTGYLASVGVPSMALPWRVGRLDRTATGLRAQVRAESAEAAQTWAPVLDAVSSIAATAFPGPAELRMVAGLGRLAVSGLPPTEFQVDVKLLKGLAADVLVSDVDGTVVARLSALRYAAVGGTRPGATSPARLLHEVVWRPYDVPATQRPAGAVVLVGPDSPLRTALDECARSAGYRCQMVTDLDGLDATADPVSVLLLPPEPLGDKELGEAVQRATWPLADTARRLSEWSQARSVLWSLTLGAREVASLDAVAQAPRWALGRVIAGEYPQLWGGSIDLDAEHPAADLGLVLSLVAARPEEDVIAIRDGNVAVARLAVASGDADAEPLRCRADATYLVTGGLGSLGVYIGRWLAGRGARRIVLAGRRSLPPRSEWDSVRDPAARQGIETVRALESLGVTVRVVALDITDRAAVAAALAPDRLGLPPVRGIVHAAGVLDNRLLRDLDPGSLATVLAPKVTGAMVLRDVFGPDQLDFLVHFSSCGLLLGLPGQASYAAANGLLDALARYDHGHGRPGALSLGWTSWRGLGMAANAGVDAELRAVGVGDISPAEASGAWSRGSTLGQPYLAVLPTFPVAGGLPRPPLLRDLTDGVAGSEVDGGPEAPFSWDLPAEERADRLLGETTRQIAAELRLGATELDPRRPLAELGMDSVLALIIRRRLEGRFGLKLPATLLWHRPTVAAIADYLLESGTAAAVAVPTGSAR